VLPFFSSFTPHLRCVKLRESAPSYSPLDETWQIRRILYVVFGVWIETERRENRREQFCSLKGFSATSTPALSVRAHDCAAANAAAASARLHACG
jgi:hypothetical protein